MGIYHVNGRKWLSMPFGKITTGSCPGQPTTQFGFSSFTNWFRCGYEVFQIYAMGKRIGDTITDQDNIALFFPTKQTYVSFLPTEHILSSCMVKRSNNIRPPTNDAFDMCPYDSVEITFGG